MNQESKKIEGKVDKSLMVRDEVCFDTVLRDVETMQKMCQTLMKTKHYQAMGEAGLFAIVQKAKSLNIHPLEALNGGLYFVQGKVGMSSEMMASLIRQAGHSIIKDQKSDNSNCILHGRRADNGDTWTVTFSMEDAKRAGLAKNMYEKYPGVMLYNRAMSMLARQLFPDVIKGAGYTQDELREIADNKHSYVQMEQAQVEVEAPKVISKEQAEEMLILLEKCPKDFSSNVTKWVTSKCGRFDQLEEKDYNAIMEKVRKKLEETLVLVSEEVSDEA